MGFDFFGFEIEAISDFAGSADAGALDDSFDCDRATLDGGSGYLTGYSINSVGLVRERQMPANIGAGAALIGD
jgi:hypothetical protein